MKQNLTITVNTDTPQFQTWFAGATKIHKDYNDKHYPNNPKEVLAFVAGPRYIKIVKHSGQVDPRTGKPVFCSAWGFIDRTNGDVLKSATWTAPAKGARGNIFDTANGLARISAYGPEYNRG